MKGLFSSRRSSPFKDPTSTKPLTGDLGGALYLLRRLAVTYFSSGPSGRRPDLTWQAKLACTETRLVSGLPMWRSGNAAPDPRTSEGVFSFRKQVADQVAQIKKPTPLRDG